MELTAKLIQVLLPQTGMGKNGEWRKQNIILETDGMYPKKVCVTIWGNKADESILKEGNLLNVSFDVESREYNGNWYTDVRAWKVELAGSAPNDVLSATADFPSSDPTPVDFGSGDGDDLPF